MTAVDELLDAIPEPEPVDVPPPPAEDERPKRGRPTTRAGRRAAAEAKAGKADRAPRSSGPSKPRTKPLADRIEGFYTTIGVGVGLALGQTDGMVIVANARSCAEAWSKAAASNPRIAEAWERILGVSVMGELLMAHAPIALTLAANHGMVPPGVAGMVPGGMEPTAPDEPTPPPTTWPAGAGTMSGAHVTDTAEPDVPAWVGTSA